MEGLEKQIRILQQQNRWQEIIDLLEPMVQNGQNEIWQLRHLGFAYSQLDRYEQARYCYKLWLESEPDKAQPYYNIGYTFYDAGQWKEAIEWFDMALEIFPDYLVCLYRKGLALFFDGKSGKAIEALTQTIAIYQQSNDADFQRRLRKYYYRAIFYLGKAYLNKRQYEKSKECFLKIRAEDRRNYIEPLFVSYNLANSLMYLNEFSEANSIVSGLVQTKPNKEWLWDFWGRLLIAQKRYKEAIEKLDRALKLRIQPYILINRARAYYFDGQNGLAKNDFHEALKRDKKGKHKILLDLAKIEFEEKHFSKAIQFAERAIEFKKRIYEVDYLEAHIFLSEVYKAIGDEQNYSHELNLAETICPKLEWEDALLVRSRIII